MLVENHFLAKHYVDYRVRLPIESKCSWIITLTGPNTVLHSFDEPDKIRQIQYQSEET